MKRFVERFFDPASSLMRYIIGTAALTVAIQLPYDWLMERYDFDGALILVVCLLLIVGVIIGLDLRRAKSAARQMAPTEKPVTPHRGLILLVSPRNKEVPLTAVSQHGDHLEHCWLVVTRQSLETAYDLAKDIHKRWPDVKVHDAQETTVDPEIVESTWKVVERIYNEDGPMFGLDESDIVSDITGGLKPMTAGMALACRPPNRKMQYVKTSRDKDGNPIPDAPRVPVLITTPS